MIRTLWSCTFDDWAVKTDDLDSRSVAAQAWNWKPESLYDTATNAVTAKTHQYLTHHYHVNSL